MSYLSYGWVLSKPKPVIKIKLKGGVKDVGRHDTIYIGHD